MTSRRIADSAVVGVAMAKTVGWKSRSPKEQLYLVPGKRQWKWLFVLDNPWFRTDDYLVIDERTRFTYEAIGTANAMVQTQGWFVYLRLYGPGETFFDRSWLPGDVKRVK